jgi:hypothetical protein
VFENKMPRRIFGLKRDEVLEASRKPQNDELHILQFSPNKIRIMRTRMGCDGYVVRMGRRRMYMGLLWESQNLRDP